MPVLNLDEIPRCAGQYFRAAGVNGDIILDANPSDACRIHAGFNRDYVSRFQAPFLPSGYPGIFVHFESKPMAGTVNKQMIEMISRQDLSRRAIHVPTGRAASCRFDRRLLGLQNRLVPSPDAFWGSPHAYRAGYVAAIVAEYSTQV